MPTVCTRSGGGKRVVEELAVGQKIVDPDHLFLCTPHATVIADRPKRPVDARAEASVKRQRCNVDGGALVAKSADSTVAADEESLKGGGGIDLELLTHLAQRGAPAAAAVARLDAVRALVVVAPVGAAPLPAEEDDALAAGAGEGGDGDAAGGRGALGVDARGGGRGGVAWRDALRPRPRSRWECWGAFGGRGDVPDGMAGGESVGEVGAVECVGCADADGPRQVGAR